MIERVRGRILEKGLSGAVLEVGGVGLRLEMSAHSLSRVPAAGEEAMMLTHLHVREDDLQLYGFLTAEERDLFRLLIGVSKIGPKLALTVLSRPPAELRRAIATGDASLFQSIPGIGKKTAERVILELREKVGEVAAAAAGVPAGGETAAGGNLETALAALRELGLTASEAERLLRDQDPRTPVNELVRGALSQWRG
ncbi:MAG: Holliday junction branch migration protein RuvA [Thermoleophilia bacterium]